MNLNQQGPSPGPSERAAALQAAVEASDDGVQVTSRDGRCLFENPTMRQLVSSERDIRRLDLTIADARRATIARGDLRLRRVHSPAITEGRVVVVTVVARTADAEYRIRGTLVSKHGDAEEMVVTWLRRCRPKWLAPALLRERYGLTPREARVAALLDAGLGSAEMAEVLAISVHTARRHAEAVLRKLGVHSRREVRERLSHD